MKPIFNNKCSEMRATKSEQNFELLIAEEEKANKNISFMQDDFIQMMLTEHNKKLQDLQEMQENTMSEVHYLTVMIEDVMKENFALKQKNEEIKDCLRKQSCNNTLNLFSM